MPVETVNYISDFNPEWPDGEETRREGDNHLRNIKVGLLGTFSGFLESSDPNFEVMTRTQAELNSIVDRVLRAGDTMEGPLLGHQIDPSSGDLEFVTKKWVENLFAGQVPGQGSVYPFGITELYKAPETQLSANTNQSFVHGLSRTPDVVTLRLRCTSTDQGYAVDDIVFVDGAQSDDTVNNQATGGIQIGGNATAIYWTMGVQAWVINKADNTHGTIDPTKWQATIQGLLIE